MLDNKLFYNCNQRAHLLYLDSLTETSIYHTAVTSIPQIKQNNADKQDQCKE
jgi:hypothetical protein